MKKYRGLIAFLLTMALLTIPFSAFAYDWSQGWEWWAQGAWDYGTDEYWYGCMVVAHAKLLVCSGIASSDPNVFNPQVLLEWERQTGHINSEFYNTNTEYTPIHYAQSLGKELYSGGITYGNDACREKIWDNISKGYYSILWIDSGSRTGHWVFVNNGGSQVMGQLRYYESGYSTTSATVNLGSATVNRVYTYYVPAPASYELDVNGWFDDTTQAVGNSLAGWATFDVYINGALYKDDVNDFCEVLPAGTAYEIKDIKPADGKAYDGLSSNARSGDVSGGRTGTLNANTDVRLTLHTVDAAAFVRNHTPSAVSVSNGHSYYFYDASVTWYDARIICEYLGGHLVTIGSAAENSFVKSMIGDSACWLGATDQDSEGRWKWVSGESFSYSNWGEDQPDNYSGNDEGAENYAHIWANGSQWNDGSGYTQWPFVCEIDRAYVVKYDVNGGTGAISPQNKAVGQTIKLSSSVPTRPGYAFLGWGASATATAAAYQPGDSYSQDKNVTLYAVWKRKVNSVLVLPGALTEIEDEAFLRIGADAVVIPAGVTRIGSHAFDDVVLYGYANSEAEKYANANGLTFIPITNDWVLDSQIPAGAYITAEKWTYTLTTAETTTSTEASLDGWTQVSFTWEQTGDGVWQYAGFPEGFDTGSALYAKYNKSALPQSKETSATTKRDAGDPEHISFIYWHWTFTDVVNDDNHNVLVEDARKLNVNIYGSVYRDFVYFDAFESTTDYGTVGPGSNGMIDVSPLRYAWRGVNEDASQWWWRFDVYQQSYADYQKLFTYVKDRSEVKESTVPVTPGGNITNVQHWVKYSFTK